jgi:hypothetical protein
VFGATGANPVPVPPEFAAGPTSVPSPQAASALAAPIATTAAALPCSRRRREIPATISPK